MYIISIALSTNTSNWRHVRCKTRVSIRHQYDTDTCDYIELNYVTFSNYYWCQCQVFVFHTFRTPPLINLRRKYTKLKLKQNKMSNPFIKFMGIKTLTFQNQTNNRSMRKTGEWHKNWKIEETQKRKNENEEEYLERWNWSEEHLIEDE